MPSIYKLSIPILSLIRYPVYPYKVFPILFFSFLYISHILSTHAIYNNVQYTRYFRLTLSSSLSLSLNLYYANLNVITLFIGTKMRLSLLQSSNRFSRSFNIIIKAPLMCVIAFSIIRWFQITFSSNYIQKSSHLLLCLCLYHFQYSCQSVYSLSIRKYLLITTL